jgi:hypothetical protein
MVSTITSTQPHVLAAFVSRDWKLKWVTPGWPEVPVLVAIWVERAAGGVPLAWLASD